MGFKEDLNELFYGLNGFINEYDRVKKDPNNSSNFDNKVVEFIDSLLHKFDMKIEQQKTEKSKEVHTRDMIELEYFEKFAEVQFKEAKTDEQIKRVMLLKRCINNVDKLKARDLRYILMSFANPEMISPQTDQEINEDLDEQIVKEKKEDVKSKKYDNLMKKDKYNEIRKKRDEI